MEEEVDAESVKVRKGSDEPPPLTFFKDEPKTKVQV